MDNFLFGFFFLKKCSAGRKQKLISQDFLSNDKGDECVGGLHLSG